MPAHRNPLRSFVLALIKSGEIATLAEAALIADVSRQTVLNWLTEIHADMETLRHARIARFRRQAQGRLERARRRMSRKGEKRELQRSIRRFNKANGHHQAIPDEAAGALPELPASGRGVRVPG